MLFQSVTGVDNADDGNSYWAVRGKMDAPCKRGLVARTWQHTGIKNYALGHNYMYLSYSIFFLFRFALFEHVTYTSVQIILSTRCDHHLILTQNEMM